MAEMLASSFNHYIGDWNTSKVTDFLFIFDSATAFNAKYTCTTLSVSVDPAICTKVRSLPIPALSDEVFHSSIAACLAKAPEDGNCEHAQYGVISGWDVSSVTDFDDAFKVERRLTAFIQVEDNFSLSMNGTFSGAFCSTQTSGAGTFRAWRICIKCCFCV